MKKILKYTLFSLLGLFLAAVVFLACLYWSASRNMKNLDYVSQITDSVQTTFYADSLQIRRLGENFLKQTPEGIWEMKVVGGDFQRGDAIGRLAEDLVYYQEKVFVDQIREIIPSDRYLRFLRALIILYNRNLPENIPAEFRNEIYGISLTGSDEFSAIGTPYQRQLNYHAAHDLGHAMQDYMLVGCSSFAVWGARSADSSLLVGRNFDFYMGDNFARNKLVSFYFPTEGYKFASVGWPGMIGVLSGMNEKGLTVTINAAKSDLPSSSATPIAILAREILQYASNIDEACAIAAKRKTFVSESLLIGSAGDGRAAIIEKSPERMAVFAPDDEKIFCTNHYQAADFADDERNMENISTTDSPYRLRRLQELEAQLSPLTPEKAVAILRNYKGLDDAELGFSNELAINQFIAHHSVVFSPEKMLMWVSDSPWQCGTFVCYNLAEIFAGKSFDENLHEASLAVSADSFLLSEDYENLLIYRKLASALRKRTKQKKDFPADSLALFRRSNPHYFHTYELLGDYYAAQSDTAQAKENWRTALRLPIPKQAERTRIEHKLHKKTRN